MTKLKVNADTWIDQSHVGTAHGGDGRLVLNNGSDKKYGLLHIGVPDLQGATVHSATLHVFIKGSSWAGANHIKVDPLDARFTEHDTWHTYNGDLPSLPTANQGDETLGGSPADGDRVDIDITDLMSDAAAADAFYGLLISTTATANRPIYSSETATKKWRPYLTISYSQAPEAPTDLAPAAGASAQDPILDWEFPDQTEYQVQLSSDGTGGGVVADSDWIVTDETSTDLSGDTSGWLTPWSETMADLDVMYWRVRAKNEVGTASEWSAWVSWTRHVYESLSIDFPAMDGDQVDATTPEIAWTFGGTQKKFQLLLDDEDGIEIYDSTRIGGDDSERSIPARTILVKNETYTLTLRVWDEFTRDATGEVGFVEETRTFYYDAGATTDPVESLTAETSADSPTVQLTWTRTSEPDWFVILADDEVIEDELDPADWFVSGITYFKKLRKIPRIDDTITYEVRARDDATGDSDGNPTADVAFRPIGIWLVYDPAGPGEIDVQFLGQEAMEMELTEDGTTFFPVGSDAPVRVVDRVRGYAGTVSGIIMSKSELADLMDIKAVPPNTGDIRLIYGGYNFPVELGQVRTSEMPVASGGRVYKVSVEYWQVGAPWPV